MPIKAIARVRRAWVAEGPPTWQRPVRDSRVDVGEPQIRELLGVYPRMPATVSAERIGWPFGITILMDRVRELRPWYRPPDPAGRTRYGAGGAGSVGQVGRPAVLVMVCGDIRK